MRTRRRSQTQTTAPAPSPLDDLLLPFSGPNAVPPERLTPRQRREEIIALLARGLLRKAASIKPFAKPTANST